MIASRTLIIWNGAGDRGDAAMIAYGASRFALSQGDAVIAEELWPLIAWCLEYNRQHLNARGVVTSGKEPKSVQSYKKEAEVLRENIEGYYGGKIEDFDHPLPIIIDHINFLTIKKERLSDCSGEGWSGAVVFPVRTKTKFTFFLISTY
jgi:hypothetical protein